MTELDILNSFIKKPTIGNEMQNMLYTVIPALSTSAVLIGAMIYMIIAQKIRKAVGVIVISVAVLFLLVTLGII